MNGGVNGKLPGLWGHPFRLIITLFVDLFTQIMLVIFSIKG